MTGSGARAILDVLIDLPFALPTIVAGLVLLSLYGPTSPVGIHASNTRLAVFLAIAFVTLPFVVRTVQPVLEEMERDVEDAAASLGASRFTTFRRVTLPTLVPAIFAGASLSFARGISEYGSLVLLSRQPALPHRGHLRPDAELPRGRRHGVGSCRRDDPAGGRAVRDRHPGHHPEAGVAPWLARPPCAQGSPAVKWGLRALVIAYLFFLVAWPTSLIVRETFRNGMQGISEALNDPDVVHALQLTLKVAIALGPHQHAVRRRHVAAPGSLRLPGKRALNAMIDVPLAISPVVVGLALVLVYNGRYGWFGPTLEDHGFQVVFALPGMILATTFVALPLVIREVVPVLEDMGDDQEQAARSLGANAWQTFRRITLPGIKWAIVYGVVLSLARSLGEFGAVKVVAGNVGGETQVATVLVQQKYQNFQQETAYSMAFMLATAAVLSLIVVALLRPKEKDS